MLFRFPALFYLLCGSVEKNFYNLFNAAEKHFFEKYVMLDIEEI